MPRAYFAPFHLADESDLEVKTYMGNCAIGQLIQISHLKIRGLALHRNP